MDKEAFPTWCLILCCLLAVIPWVAVGLDWPDIIVARLGHCKELYCDFTRHYYPQANWVALGKSGIVDGWFYPPTLALMISGIGHLSLSQAIDMWTLVSMATAVGYIVLCAQSLRDSKMSLMKRILLSTAVVSTSFPVLSALKWGQISLFIVLIILLAIRRQSAFTGWLLGLAGAIKIYPLTLSAVPLLNKRYRQLAFVGLSALLFGLIWPILSLGVEETWKYFGIIMDSNQTLQMRAPRWGGQAWGPSAHRWFISGAHMTDSNPSPLLFSLPPILFTVCNIALMIGLALCVLSVYRRVSAPLGAALVLCWFGLFSPPGWHHYFCFLPFCQLMIWQWATKAAQRYLIGVAFLMERGCVLAMLTSDSIYYDYSQFGITTLTVLTTLIAGLWGMQIKDIKNTITSLKDNKT